MRWWIAAFVIISSVFSGAITETRRSDDENRVTHIAIPKYNTLTTNKNLSRNVTSISAAIPGLKKTGVALQHVISRLVNASQVQNAQIVPAPPECNSPRAADDDQCLTAMLNELSTGAVTVAILPISSLNARTSRNLHFGDISEQGDITDRTRRACKATGSAAPLSLLDLTDVSIAAKYHIPENVIDDELRRLTGHSIVRKSVVCDTKAPLVPERCSIRNCATILTSDESEACIYADVIEKHQLNAIVRPLGDHLPEMVATVTSPLVVCDWAPEFSDVANLSAVTLGPPPCEPLERHPCPFETRRVVALVNYKLLKQSAINALTLYKVNATEMRELSRTAIATSPENAAAMHWKLHPWKIHGEVRVIVMIPGPTSRHVYSGALSGAAGIHADLLDGIELNPQVYNDECQATIAMKALQNEQHGNGYRSLSAIAGPVCADAWMAVAHLTTTYRLPLLAYTPQVPTSETGEGQIPLQLLGAGDAREGAAALGALSAHLRWRRFGALSEHATRPLLNALGVPAKLDVDYQLQPSNTFEQHLQQIAEWAELVVRENTQIIYLCVEDARLARAAVCASKNARGSNNDRAPPAVWLVCSLLPPDWLQSAHNESCTTEELQELTAGYFSTMPEWASDWYSKANNASEERTQVEEDIQKACIQYYATNPSNSTKSMCKRPIGPYEALLYDLFQMWILALGDLLEKYPIAIDEMHDAIYVKSLIDFVTSKRFTNEYQGLTGYFNWTATEYAYVRSSPIILLQWQGDDGPRIVGRWNNGSLALNESALRWYTHDGKPPDDGSERCAVQGLADVLHTDCRTSYVALGSILAAILIASLISLAMYCKRRAEKEYRKRLAALGMRPLGLLKPSGLDRWEVPRERVVINRKLGTGAFGTVYGGHALLADNRGWTAVAVKTLKAGTTTEEKLDFLSEAEAMKRFDHKNVVRLLGVVTKTEPVCTVMEFMLYGDLKNYLLARRHLAWGGGFEEDNSAGGDLDEASPQRLTSMALDVARALSYLAQLRYVHRDVAARNCLVSARRTVKLADFGMTRLVFENDYYRFSRKGMLPVRWMAPESLALGVFSPASDVWSFGVLLYEIVTFGSLPFQGLSNSEVLTRVKGGHTLELPPGLKPQLEGLIKSCWSQDSKTRPTASEVAAYLADAPRLLTPCLDVPLDALPLEADPPWKLPPDQAEARWVSWAAPASAATDTTYLSTEGTIPLDTDSFLS